MSTVGWVGLGAMGSPMAVAAARAGHQVKAFDVVAGRAQELATEGVSTAGSVAEAATEVDLLVVMVATAGQAESVLFGPDPAVGALRRGAVVLLMATVGPAAVESFAFRLAASGVELVDAPVSGGTARAATGDLLIMVSGTDAAVSAARPLLDALASNAPVVGGAAGVGQKVKLVNQLLCGVHIAVAGEALAFAEALGLDAAATLEILRHGAAASFMFGDRGSRMVDEGNTEVRSAIDIFVKDMGLVTDAARAGTYPAPLAAVAEQLFLSARRAGLGRADDSSVIQVLRGTASRS